MIDHQRFMTRRSKNWSTIGSAQAIASPVVSDVVISGVIGLLGIALAAYLGRSPLGRLQGEAELLKSLTDEMDEQRGQLQESLEKSILAYTREMEAPVRRRLVYSAVGVAAAVTGYSVFLALIDRDASEAIEWIAVTCFWLATLGSAVFVVALFPLLIRWVIVGFRSAVKVAVPPKP